MDEVKDQAIEPGKKERYNGKANLVDINTRTPEERKAMGAKGGVKSGESKRRTKDMRELAKALLESSYSSKKAQEILGDDIEQLEGNLTLGNVLNMRMIQEAKNGNIKAFEAIRDTAGYKPSESINLDANIMTEQDKKLLDKVARRTGVGAET